MTYYRKQKSLKMLIVMLALALSGIGYLVERRAQANSGGPPTARTGAPGDLTCNASGCHNSFGTNSGNGVLNITGLPASYVGGQRYTLTVTLSQASPVPGAYGFQLTALNPSNARAGTLASTTNRTFIQTDGSTGRQYISHNGAGNNPVNGMGSWTFDWTAPATSAGTVTFYVAGNAADGTGGSNLDRIYTKSMAVSAQTALAATTVGAAGYSQTEPVTAEGIAAVFGTSLATADGSATTVPLPTTLQGTTVRVRDSAGTERAAPLFFVSAGQVNFQIPANTANGTATITITSGNGTVSTSTKEIATAAPSLFAANSFGAGAAAGYVIRVRNGQQLFESIWQAPGGNISTLPISLGPSTDQLVLVLFGLGARGNTNISNVTTTIGGAAASTDFAGAHCCFIGLDQFNITIPRTVTTGQNLNVVVTISGRQSNAVQVQFTS
ncbi:MAG: choice-of-anchor V domain-containing protein [Blastocatellia bacterium]